MGCGRRGGGLFGTVDEAHQAGRNSPPAVGLSLGWRCGVRAGPTGVQFEGEIMSAGRPL